MSKSINELSPEAKEARRKYYREYMRAYRERNRKRNREYHREWKARNPEKVKQHTANYWEKVAQQESK